MPTYQITGPNGEVFEVTGEGTEQDALAHIQAQYESQPQRKPFGPKDPAITAAAHAARPDLFDTDYQYNPTSGMSGAEKFDAGVGKSFVDTGRGFRQLYSMAADKIAPRRNLSSLIVDNSRTAQAQRAVDESAGLDAPLMRTGAGITGNIAGQVAQFAAPAGAVGRAASLGGNVLRSAATGAALANTQPVQTGQSRLANTALGAAGGAAGEVLAAGIGKAATAASSKIDPAVKALAERARKLGIPLRAEQVSGSRPLAGISASLDSVPFSGRGASREAQRMGFNRAVSRTLGEDSANLATAVAKAQSRLGSVYDDVLKSNPVKVDTAFMDDLTDVLQAARNELTDAQFSVIARQADNIMGKATGDVIDGQAAYNIKKMLDRIGRSSDTSLASNATDLKNALMGALDRSLPEAAGKQFATARQQYRNLIAIRKLVKAGAEGNVSPASLGNLKNLAPDLKEVADIGAQFLKEPFGNSGTANRLIGAGAIGGLGTGALFDPALAATVAASGATVGRGANMALNSKVFQDYLMNGNQALKYLLPSARRVLPAAGTALAVSGQ